MSCTNENFYQGATINDPTINRPIITDGKATGIEINSGTLTGSLTIDDNVADNLATRLCPLIQDCVDVPLTVAASSAASTTGTDLPTTVIGSKRTMLMGEPDGYLKFTTDSGEVFLIPAFHQGG